MRTGPERPLVFTYVALVEKLADLSVIISRQLRSAEIRPCVLGAPREGHSKGGFSMDWIVIIVAIVAGLLV